MGGLRRELGEDTLSLFTVEILAETHIHVTLNVFGYGSLIGWMRCVLFNESLAAIFVYYLFRLTTCFM